MELWRQKTVNNVMNHIDDLTKALIDIESLVDNWDLPIETITTIKQRIVQCWNIQTQI